jgi:hypothetical protein
MAPPSPNLPNNSAFLMVVIIFTVKDIVLFEGRKVNT